MGEPVKWWCPKGQDAPESKDVQGGEPGNLDISILRNPLTVLSVFAPLLISALAAFLPQAAG
jgi:hypothetical protein